MSATGEAVLDWYFVSGGTIIDQDLGRTLRFGQAQGLFDLTDARLAFSRPVDLSALADGPIYLDEAASLRFREVMAAEATALSEPPLALGS